MRPFRGILHKALLGACIMCLLASAVPAIVSFTHRVHIQFGDEARVWMFSFDRGELLFRFPGREMVYLMDASLGYSSSVKKLQPDQEAGWQWMVAFHEAVGGPFAPSITVPVWFPCALFALPAWLLRYLEQKTFRIFVIYRILLGVLICVAGWG